MTLPRHHEGRFPVYASSGDYAKSEKEAKECIRRADDVNKKLCKAKVAGTTIDYSWLKGAAETYQLSANIEDYVITEVPIVTVDVPNRNLHCFPYEEVTYFDPRFGQFVYKTFIGKPVYSDHCFPAGTMISTTSGMKPIEEVGIGEMVFTDQMRSRPVTNLIRNGVKQVTKIQVQGLMEPLEATENHPILVVDRRQIFGKYDENYQIYKKRIRKDDFREIECHPHFRPVSDIYVGDYVAIPINYGGTAGKVPTCMPSKHDSGRGVIWNNLLLMPVTKLDRNHREAEVFNLEVEEDHTYIAGGIIVHNCNKDFTKAKGVHFDASLRKVPGWDIWKIYVLIGYDRTKDVSLAREIEKGLRRGYSMGAWVSYFVNSVTGQIENGSQPLKYPKGSLVNNQLSYSNCTGVEFFETSSLVTGKQADASAESHQLWLF